MADARHVRFARELEQRDAAIAADLTTVRGLQADVEELRAHADAAAAFRDGYPEERRRLERALAEAEQERQAREADLAAAEAGLQHAKPGNAQAAAERALTRTRDAASSARKRVTRVEDERDAVERSATETEAQLPRLRARTAELAARLREAPRASAVEPTEPADWAARARASLFSAAAGLETERERIVREANELAAAALGDPASATSVSLVRQRIEST